MGDPRKYISFGLAELVLIAAGTASAAVFPQWTALIWTGIAVFGLLAFPIVWGFGPTRSWFKANGEALVILGMFVAVVGGVVWGLVSGVRWYLNRPVPPQMDWVHPTMPAQEQRIEHAECRMEALDANSDANIHVIDRAIRSFEEACLTSRGFSYEQVSDSD